MSVRCTESTDERGGEAGTNIPGSDGPEGGPGPDYLAYVFIFLISTIMCRFYILNLSEQVTRQITVSLPSIAYSSAVLGGGNFFPGAQISCQRSSVQVWLIFVGVRRDCVSWYCGTKWAHFDGRWAWRFDEMINDKKTVIGNWAPALFCVPQRYKWQEDEEEGVSGYWMTLRKREDTGNWKRKH